VRSKVVRLEEIADVQYGGVVEKFVAENGVAEKFADLSVEVDFVADSSVSVSDGGDEERQAGWAEKFQVMSIDCKGDADVDALNAEKENENQKEEKTERNIENLESKKTGEMGTGKKKERRTEKITETQNKKKNEGCAETKKGQDSKKRKTMMMSIEARSTSGVNRRTDIDCEPSTEGCKWPSRRGVNEVPSRMEICEL